MGRGMTPEQKQELGAMLDRKHIAKRNQGQTTLSYIEGHHAIREANRIFDFDGWTRETFDWKLVQQEVKKNSNNRELNYVAYLCMCRVTVEGIVREGVGFGQGQDADLGKAHESAAKEAETDAMKRALMTFGDPFGLALYDKTQSHVTGGNQPQNAPQSNQPANMSEQEAQRNAGLYFRRDLGGDKAKMDDFKASLADGKNWWDVLLEAEREGVTVYEDLALYVISAGHAHG